MPRTTIHVGDNRASLKTLPDKVFQCVVTSPPYWNLRDYGEAGQLGREKTLDEYVANLVDVFTETHRCLRDDGVLWLNLGDCYARPPAKGKEPVKLPRGCKTKDLVGVPWAVAFALRRSGWYLRSHVTWSKPNTPPEPAQDRPVVSDEDVFLLTKSSSYFFDSLGAEEPAVSPGRTSGVPRLDDPWRATRSARTVWAMSGESFKGAHSAVFPVKFAKRCLKAGASEAGACSFCGSPLERVLERLTNHKDADYTGKWAKGSRQGDLVNRIKSQRGSGAPNASPLPRPMHRGWKPSCACEGTNEVTPCVVADVFGGSGTTAIAASRLGLDCVLFELNPRYAAMAAARIKADFPLGNEVEVVSH